MTREELRRQGEATQAQLYGGAVPNLLYKRELRDLNGPTLRRLGLCVESLYGEGIWADVEHRRRITVPPPLLTASRSRLPS